MTPAHVAHTPIRTCKEVALTPTQADLDAARLQLELYDKVDHPNPEDMRTRTSSTALFSA